MPFSSLAPVIQKAINHAGYTDTTPVQKAALPIACSGKDLIAIAQTGTGKTAGFVLPALQRLLDSQPGRGRGPRILILAPTRELALQVKDSAEKYAKFMHSLNIVSVLGGMSYFTQNKQLSKPVDILIATPGRLLDHLERGRIDFSRLEMLILDEADRMLDMGFFDDVERIVNATPATRQTLMFSATFDKPIARLAERLLQNPERVDIATGKARHTQIEQSVHYVTSTKHKKQLLLQLLENDAIEQAIIFTSTKRLADELADDLQEHGYAAAALHGDMRQQVRNRTLDLLRRGRIRYLVATDVAARGIDVASISHVFNYDLPRVIEDYVHRIGRTGRAGAFGTAISLATLKEKGLVKRIERYIGHNIAIHKAGEFKGANSQRAEVIIKSRVKKVIQEASTVFSSYGLDSRAEKPARHKNGNRASKPFSDNKKPRRRADQSEGYRPFQAQEQPRYADGRKPIGKRNGIRYSGNNAEAGRQKGERYYPTDGVSNFKPKKRFANERRVQNGNRYNERRTTD